MNVDIGTMIVSSPDFKHGRPHIAGTGLTVHRIAIWYKLGHSPEEIARRYGHITVAQVHAAIAHYLANQARIDAEIAAEEAEAERLEQDYLQQKRIA
ncbi:MAG: DUF433 domain-containing protein [Blastocatellia bacterium]